MSCKRRKTCSGALRYRITVERRSLGHGTPGSAEPRHSYATVLTARADVKTKAGSSQFNQVEIDGEKATHVMTIRHTTIAIDARDRVRDVRGNLYKILSIENPEMRDDQLKLYCALTGHETRIAAQ